MNVTKSQEREESSQETCNNKLDVMSDAIQEFSVMVFRLEKSGRDAAKSKEPERLLLKSRYYREKCEQLDERIKTALYRCNAVPFDNSSRLQIKKLSAQYDEVSGRFRTASKNEDEEKKKSSTGGPRKQQQQQTMKQRREQLLSTQEAEEKQRSEDINAFKSDILERLAKESGKDVSQVQVLEVKKQDPKKLLSRVQQATVAVEELIARDARDSLQQLQTDFQELHEQFVDLSALIAEQGDGIDKIQENVEATIENVDIGTENIKSAKTNLASGGIQQLLKVSPLGVFSLLLK